MDITNAAILLEDYDHLLCMDLNFQTKSGVCIQSSIKSVKS